MAVNLSPNGGSASVVSPMSGATSSTAGVAGNVPTPTAGQHKSVLTGAGIWVAPEFGFVNLAAQALTASGTAYVDVVGSSMTLTAGTWEVTYSVTTDFTASTTFSVSQVVVTDSANTVVEGSQSTRPGSNTAAVHLARVIHITVATPTTYKLRVSNGAGSGLLSVLNTTTHKSTMSWKKLV